jgi:hypothetical protein
LKAFGCPKGKNYIKIVCRTGGTNKKGQEKTLALKDKPYEKGLTNQNQKADKLSDLYVSPTIRMNATLPVEAFLATRSKYSNR